MTRVLTFACALLALGLAAWALYASGTTRGRLEQSAQLVSGLDRFSRENAAERLAAQAQAEVAARPPQGADRPPILPTAPLPLANREGGDTEGGEAGEASAPLVGLATPLPAPTPRLQRSSSTTLGYTLPSSATPAAEPPAPPPPR